MYLFQISDADQNILHVDVTFGGSVSDSYIFANTRVKAQLEDLNNNGESVHVLGKLLLQYNDKNTSQDST